MSTQTFPISGMTCQHCVTRVQTLLSSVSGVRNVTVDLMPPRAHIDGENIDPSTLATALAGTQFNIKTEAVTTKKMAR